MSQSVRTSELKTRRESQADVLPTELLLVVLSGQARGMKVRVGSRVRIGKASDNDLVLPDDTVSRHHCELERDASGVTLRDLGSTNQTRVGANAVREASIQPGTTLTVGEVDLLLRSEPNYAEVLPSESDHFGDLVGKSVAMRALFGVLERIAPTDASILIEGETGTGKDLVARSIHGEGPRAKQPYVVVDCGAVSYNLLESELFGHERGAFTGAVQARQGAFEAAGHGTLFLDEVGELPLDVQPKLLRVLETGEFRRVGGNRVLHTDARIIAATKRDLKEEVRRGKFREDLYYRLSVVPIAVPPLRTRREDIPLLVTRFLERAVDRTSARGPVRLSRKSSEALAAHDWPGNVRELRNVLDRALYLTASGDNRELDLVELPVAAKMTAERSVLGHFDAKKTYRETREAFEAEFERRYIEWLLARHDGNLAASAREARMDRKHLHDLARKHGLRTGRR